MAADPLTSRTVDDLLADDINFDSDDDIFGDKRPRNTERDDKAVLSPRKRKAEDENPFAGNVDEEVKIVKQRKKIPKLDADRLLSEPGIPKIRQLLRSGGFNKKLRLKGKGHEFSDAAKLLNYYQLWLDQLYPRAKFADAVQLVEKAGHTKKMQMYRKSWIDEGKPGHMRREDAERAVAMHEQEETAAETQRLEADKEAEDMFEEDPASMFIGGGNQNDEAGAPGPDDDELDALLAQDDSGSKTSAKRIIEDDSEGEDDLDALLAEQDSRKPKPPQQEYEDEDDLDALLHEHETTSNKPHTKVATAQIQEETDTTQDEDGDELDALLGGASHASDVVKATNGTTAAPPGDEMEEFADHDDDDFGDLLANEGAASEPELPALATNARIDDHNLASKVTGLPGSEEVPELDNVVSSSPIPNVQTNELDDLLDEHDAAIKQKAANNGIVEEFMSSSPIPNRDSQ